MTELWPAAERNKEPILAVLRERLPRAGVVLEVASGTGQHAVHFARGLPQLTFQPSDLDAKNLDSIRGHRHNAGLDNLLPPLRLDVTEEAWDIDSAAAVLCSNMIHIAPWAATEGLFRGAARILPKAGVLLTYGPYRFQGEPFAPSNASFDASLRARDAAWGVRDAEAVIAAAVEFSFVEAQAMPANNHILHFVRR